MIRFRVSLAGLACAALITTGCGMESTSAPESPSAETAAFKTNAMPSSAASYLLIAGNKLPRNLAAAVEKAGGELDATIPQIGIAVASSTDPDFDGSLRRIRGVSAVVPNVTVEHVVPMAVEAASPPFTGDDDFFFDLQWGHDAVDAPEAWETGERGAGVRVAILDGGMDIDHPDLAPNLNLDLSASFVPGEGIEYAPAGPFSHATHVAGTVAAADNGFGVIGIAPEAELVAVKVLTDGGSGDFSWVIQGIVYAADIGADVINMSLGGYVVKSGFPEEGVGANDIAALRVAIARAVAYAYQSGTTVITSAGNGAIDGDKDKNLVHLPSDVPHAISVSATGPQGWATDPGNIDLDTPASYTNYGQSVITLAAPGGDYVYPGEELCSIAGLTRPCWVFDLVFSTGNGGWYWSAGTSMAAPHVAGVAALIIGQAGGDMHPAQVESALRRSADDLGKPGNDDFYGRGRVNAFNAVN